MAPVVREALRAVDPDLPLLQPQALTTRIAQTVANRKLALRLLEAFAVLALVIATLGVYSVMAHLVAYPHERDRSPHGARRLARRGDAHGARARTAVDARRHRVGIVGALVVSRLMQQALFEVEPADPVVYVTLAVVFLLVTECASWFPARRATKIDPVIALRAE